MKCENEILKSEVESLNESLASVKEQLKSEQNQVETLMEELAQITQDNVSFFFSFIVTGQNFITLIKFYLLFCHFPACYAHI